MLIGKAFAQKQLKRIVLDMECINSKDCKITWPTIS